MNYLLISLYSIITIICFVKKKEYVLATFLVGQPILKLMIKPFNFGINPNLYLLYYMLIGFITLFFLSYIRDRKISVSIKSLKIIMTNVIFGFLMIIYALISPVREYGFSKVTDYFTIIFLLIVLSVVLIKDAVDFARLVAAISNIALLIGIITIFAIYINTGDIFARLSTTQAREIQLYGVNFSVSIWFGRRMGLGFISSLYEFKTKPTKLNKLKTLLLFILTVLSVSRGPIISLIITLFIMQIVEGKFKNRTKVFKYTVVLLSIFIIGSTLSLSALEESPFNRLISFEDGNTQDRYYMYKTGVNMFVTNPMGIGLGGFSTYGGLHKYPHNLTIELISEMGIIGLSMFLFFIIQSFYNYYKVKVRNIERAKLVLLNYALSILIFALINSQFSGDISSNEYVWVGIAFISILKNNIGSESMEGICLN